MTTKKEIVKKTDKAKPKAIKAVAKKKTRASSTSRVTKEPKYTIKDIKLKDILPNTIDNVSIYMDDNDMGDNFKEAIYLPSDMGKLRFAGWLRGRGGMIYKDLKDSNRKGIKHKYALINRDGERMIVRLIEKSEMGDFLLKKLVDGKAKDTHYMIIKNLKVNEPIKSYKKDFIEDATTIDILVTNNEPAEVDSNDYETNVALFSE